MSDSTGALSAGAGAWSAVDIQFSTTPGLIDLTWGHPDPGLLPVDAVAAATAHVLAAHGNEALSYGAPAGPGGLRLAIADHLTASGEGVVDPRSVLITAGASGGLDTVMSLLSRPGDVVLVEQPTYFLALRVLADHGVEVIGVDSDEHGIDPDDLAARCASFRSRGIERVFLYCIPTFANPTGRSLPGPRRLDLLDVARRNGITVIEDDVYRDTADDPPPSLWSVDPETVIRLGSFSKSIAPGLRVGFLTADPATVSRIEGCGLLDSGGGLNHFAAMVVGELITSGVFAEITARARATYARHRVALVDAIDVEVLCHRRPDGGFFVWLAVPDGVTSAEFVAAARANAVLVTDGTAFFAGASFGQFVRASFSMVDDEQLAAGGAILTATARELSRTGPSRR